MVRWPAWIPRTEAEAAEWLATRRSAGPLTQTERRVFGPRVLPYFDEVLPAARQTREATAAVLHLAAAGQLGDAPGADHSQCPTCVSASAALGGPPADEPVHPAGAGTAPDLMARALALVVPTWGVVTTQASWIAADPDLAVNRAVRVDVDPRHWKRARWAVSGQHGGSGAIEVPEISFSYAWHGFRANEADRVIAALRAFGVLPLENGR